MLAVTKDTYAGHARSPWLVVVPRRLSPTGRRQYKRFGTRARAQAFAAALRGQVRSAGEQPLSAIPSSLAADAQAAASLLEGSGLTLVEAVRQLLERGQPSSVAIPPACSPGGAGERIQEKSICAPPAGAADDITLNAMLHIVEQAKSHQARATRTTRRYVCTRLFASIPGIADTPMSACTPAMIQRGLDLCWSHSPQQWNTGKRVLSAIFSYAIRRQYIPGPNPLSALDMQHVKEEEIHALPPATLRSLFAACRPATAVEKAAAAGMSHDARHRALIDTSNLRCYIALCAFAGIRPTECSRLTWGDIGWEDSVISVRAANSKTGGTRHIEMHPTLRAWLLAYRPADATESTPIAPTSSLPKRLQMLRHRAGFNAEHPWQNDCLRHSYATYYLRAGGELQRLQLNMGHRDLHLLYTRYTNMRGVTRAMAEEWWQILPTDTGGAGEA